MIRALLFDLDETLLDRTTSIQAFLAQQYARFTTELAHIPFAHYCERFLILDNFGYIAKEVVYSQLVDDFDLDLNPVQLLDDYYINSGQLCIFFAGALELLAQTRANGYKLAIVTNGLLRTQQPRIMHSALQPLIDQGLISEAEGVRKPEAEIFLRAAQRLGVEPQECVMIGDNPHADVWGAMQVGMKTIWRQGHLPWPAELALRPQRTVESVGELIGFDWQQLCYNCL